MPQSRWKRRLTGICVGVSGVILLAGAIVVIKVPASRLTPTRALAPQPSPRLNCMPVPSSCGFPDMTNTGVRNGTILTPDRGVVVLERPGEIYENRVLTGSIIVRARNVVIRNVRLIDTDPYYAIRMNIDGNWEDATGNMLIEDSEIDLNGKLGDPGGGDLKGIAFSGYTARRVLFRNGNDCAHMGENVVIEDSMCVVGLDANRDAWPDGGAYNHDPSWCRGGGQHFDGFQSDGGNLITLHHNTIRNPCGQTSAILMSSNTSPISNVRITNNLMAGGGWTLFCRGDDRAQRVRNETVRDNRFARTYWSRAGFYGPAAHCEPAPLDDSGGNIWDDTGASLGF
jgi:hypothetical protein